MNKKRSSCKWILIAFFVTLFSAPTQSVFASSWVIKYQHGYSPEQQHYNQYRYNQYRYKQRHYYRNKAIRHRNKYYGQHRFNAHYGHNHGRIVSLPVFSTSLFVGGHKYHHDHGVYYKNSVCGYYVVPDPH